MTRHLPALFGATGTLLAAAPTWAEYAGQGYDSHMGGGWGWGQFIFGPLMMILVIGAIVALVVVLVRWIGGTAGGGSRPQDQIQTLALPKYKEHLSLTTLREKQIEIGAKIVRHISVS